MRFINTHVLNVVYILVVLQHTKTLIRILSNPSEDMGFEQLVRFGSSYIGSTSTRACEHEHELGEYDDFHRKKVRSSWYNTNEQSVNLGEQQKREHAIQPCTHC